MPKKAPKCKECSDHKIYPITEGLKDRHWCGKVKVMRDFDKSMDAKDVITSPKWCPKRENTVAE